MKREGMEKGGKILAAGIAAVLIAAFLPGCAKQATPENLLRDMSRSMDAVDSMLYNVAVTAEMSGEGTGITVNMDLDIENVKEPEAVHITGRLGMNMLGTDIATDLEMYTVSENGGYTTYTKAGEIWVKSQAEEVDGSLEAGIFNGMQEQASLFEVSGEPADVNGRECYELTGDIGGETLEDILDDDMLSALSGLAIDEDTFDGAEVPCTLDIYRGSILPARILIDLRDLAGNMGGAVAEAGGARMDVSEYFMEITFLEYDGIREIEVPEEALEAWEAGSIDEEMLPFLSEGDVESSSREEGADAGADQQGGAETVLEPADQTGELGTRWDSYTVQINDKVITLPCTTADLEEAGFRLDTDYLPEDSMIHDFGTAWFADENGNEILADLLPVKEETQAVSDCLVAGITVSAFDTTEGGIDIVFPGGIRTGSMVEDVLTAYGETEDVYEGEAVDIYSWYEEDSYYNGCSIDVDAESGAVTEIRLGRYE